MWMAIGGERMTKRHSILVVDDDSHVRSLYFDALSEAGHSVALAVDGLDAVAALPREIDLAPAQRGVHGERGQVRRRSVCPSAAHRGTARLVHAISKEVVSSTPEKRVPIATTSAHPIIARPPIRSDRPTSSPVLPARPARRQASHA